LVLGLSIAHGRTIPSGDMLATSIERSAEARNRN
jgi:hypothetical protein